ncbi:MAG: hypothetical protein GTN53_27740, partial [Candidatus Aminicenantes bacterium]|nr:hypothetical protein [Gammaproteobacteria bacterium]NIO84311.1 hypothetical protein [Candidatus Aminicenantes bacterium]NIQ70277.1 hypothetical protein [Candidatus Aminicenantes bacterium]NIT26308.1 hypothetical protein [Candidatus Aminicenantes bacterium]
MIKRFICIVFCVLIVMFFVFASEGPQRVSKASLVGKEKPTIARNFGNIPLYFIPNRGQMNEKALFCAKTRTYTLWITKEGLVFDSLYSPHSPHSPHLTKHHRDVSRFIFWGADRNPEVVPEKPAAHRVNYLKGSDKSQWHTHIPTSRAVCYKNLYKNIDLKVYGIEKQIEYDWVVKPGGNPAAIRLQYQEVKNVSINEKGNLAIETAFGQWTHKKPLAYQVIDGKKKVVQAAFEVQTGGKNIYGFKVGLYDKNYELIIDPMVIAYSSYLGGSDCDEVWGMTLDSTGAVYAVGDTLSPDFPLQSPYQSTLQGEGDGFISKLSPDGKSLVFSTFLGGESYDTTHAVALDNSGNVVVGGITDSSGFPTVNPFQGSLSGTVDGFISMLSPDGSTLLYSTYLGGSDFDKVNDIAVSGSGEVYAAGETTSNDFPLQDAVQTTWGGDCDAFVVKFMASGASLVFSTYLGGTEADMANCIDLDSSGCAYVAGRTSSSEFPTVNAFQSSLADTGEYGYDGFLTKFSSDGSSLVYSTYLGGSDSEEITDMVVTGSGVPYLTGYTTSSDFPTTPGAFLETKPGTSNQAFVTKFSSSGTAPVYSTFLGGSGGFTEAFGITIDAAGSAYVTGLTNSPNFPLVDAFRDNLEDSEDAFITRLNPDGSMLEFSSFLGGCFFDMGEAVEVDSAGNIYVTGRTDWCFQAYKGFQEFGGGDDDGFIAKLVYSPYSNITVIAPNGGENWQALSSQVITWTAPETIENVYIEYSIDNGYDWYIITQSTPNTGSYNWTVPDTPASGCKIYIFDAYMGGTMLDASDGEFTITPVEIFVTAPNGGETWVGLSTRTITWTAPPLIENVGIEYSTDSGFDWTTITNSTSNTGSYQWTIPDTPSPNCLVRVYDPMGYATDQSDAEFIIMGASTTFISVQSPNGGEEWCIGSSYDITWSYGGPVENVSIDYSTDNGGSWTPVVSSIPNTGSYNWTIPDTSSSQCLVRVREPGGTPSDTSDAVFTITTPMIPLAERNALIALYNGTNGDSWNGNMNWRHPEDPTQFNDRGTEHTWWGITCNEEKTHVKEIYIYSNGLDGNLPDLGALTELTVLNLEHNLLHGNIPTTLNNLHNLKELVLYLNQYTGSIPDLSGMTSLEKLNLDYNQLTGSIPVSLNNLTNLKTLSLRSNQLGGPIPDLSGLINLQSIDLSHNQLTGNIPASFNQMTALNEIYLDDNQLTGSIPDLTNLPLLDWLVLSDNQLSGSIPPWFNQMTQFTGIYLNGNEFTGTIPDLGNLVDLWSLSLADNRLSGGIPAEIGNLTTLRYFRLNGNQLTGSIPGTLTNLVNLYSDGLNISWNGLYTDDTALRDFLNSKHGSSDWESTQTIAPSGVSAGSETHESVRISWTPVEYKDVTGGYRVYYSTTPGSGYTLSGATPDKYANSHTVQGLEPETTYYFVVETFSDPHSDNQNTVTSEYSTEISAVTLETPTLTVTAPNGGETWEGNTIGPITWTHTGSIDYVTLEYSTDNGSTWNEITSSTLNTGSYDWTIPNTPSGNCLVKISDTGGLVSDVSDAVFTIAAQRTLTVTAPNGGESWEAGTNQNITWTSTGSIANVKIEYSRDNGSSWITITDSTANSGTYSWTVPNPPCDICLVRITDTAGPASDVSDAVFSIAQDRSVSVMIPNGGESWEAGTAHDINWAITGNIVNVKIEYSTDSGSSWNTISDSTPITGEYNWYNWTVPNTPSTTCLVRVSDTAGPASDTSNNVFTIAEQRTLTVTSPNGGENWEGGFDQTITWTSTGSIPNVKIEYSTDSGASWNTIASSTENDGAYEWYVPNTPSSVCLVRVSDIAGPAADISDAVFTIVQRRTVTVTAPNGGENWEAVTVQTITWTSTGSIANVVIDYSTDDGSSWNTVTTSTPNTGTYDWTIPNTPSSGCRVRIGDAAGPYFDLSDAVFTILEQRTINVTTPNGGEDWDVGSLHDITWNTTGAVSNVAIDYSIDGGSSWNSIVSSTANTGTYSWTVPDTPSSDCLVKISDTAGPAADSSDAAFTISIVTIPAAERDALIALYNSTNGDNWNNNTNWRKPGDPTQFNDPGTENTWYGVTCNVDNTQVDRIELNSNNLVGTIPADLDQLTHLYILTLSSNQLTGTIPDLGSLTNLIGFDLYYNQLSGGIPTWLNNLTGLTQLRLGYNQLGGTIPDLGSLTQLSILNLQNDQLSGTIPAWLNNLTDLTNL